MDFAKASDVGEAEALLLGKKEGLYGGAGAGETGHGKRSRSLGVLSIACMGFLAVSAGPYGIEEAVQAAGPGVTLLAILLLPFLWGLPMASMTAEMSTMLPENGGYVLWARRGLGNFGGWMCAYNSVSSNLTDLPLYALMLAAYLQNFLQRSYDVTLSDMEIWGIKMAVCTFVFLVNVRGIASVSIAAFLMTLFIVTPFLMEPVLAASRLSLPAMSKVPASIDWSTFVGVILWNYSGWDGLGCVSGEVKDGRRTYPLGIMLGLMLLTATYFAPVAVGVTMFPDLSMWEDGLLETIARQISPWLGFWVILGALVSNVGEFNVVMCTSSWALCAMAQRKMVPSVLARESQTYGTPVAALVLQMVSTVLMVSLSDFSTLVVLDTMFNNLSLVLESASFVVLKHTEPDTPRPFRVPGGLWGALAVVAPKAVIIGFNFATAAAWSLWVVGIANALFVLGYLLRQRLVSDPIADAMDSASSVSVYDDDGSSVGTREATDAEGMGPAPSPVNVPTTTATTTATSAAHAAATATVTVPVPVAVAVTVAGTDGGTFASPAPGRA